MLEKVKCVMVLQPIDVRMLMVMMKAMYVYGEYSFYELTIWAHIITHLIKLRHIRHGQLENVAAGDENL